MQTKRAVCCGFVLILAAVLAVVPAAAADKSDIAGLAAVWEKSITPATLPLAVALCASDGCRMPPNQEAVDGSEAILAQLQAGKDRGLAKVKIAVSSGDLRYGIGTYEITGADASHVDHGKWMLVSRSRTGYGKLSATVFNSDMPMPAMK